MSPFSLPFDPGDARSRHPTSGQPYTPSAQDLKSPGLYYAPPAQFDTRADQYPAPPGKYYTPPARYDTVINEEQWVGIPEKPDASPQAYASPAQGPYQGQREARPTLYQHRDVNQSRPNQNLQQPISKTAPATQIKIHGTDHMVVKILQRPQNDLRMMSDGVRVIKDRNGLLLVQKRLKMTTRSMRDRAGIEKKALFEIANAGGSRNINQVFRAVWDGKEQHSSLLLEFCDHGTLEGYIDSHRIEPPKAAPENFCWRVLSQLAAALAMCHEGIQNPLKPYDKSKAGNWNTIFHLDIKPANVFLSSRKLPGYENEPWPRVVLGDFGCCLTREDVIKGNEENRSQPYGTEGWFPPENKSGGKDPSGKVVGFGKHTDVWQMGAIIQVMCKLWVQPPNDPVDPPCGDEYSADLNLAVRKCMAGLVDQRPTAIEAARKIKEMMKA